jgi:replicative DNA helicase
MLERAGLISDKSVAEDAECSILGAILVNQKLLPDTLKAEDFTDLRNRTIFEAILSLSDKSIDIDLLTVKAELGSGLERAGGVAYLAGLSDGMPRLESVSQWVKIVKEASVLNLLKDDLDRANRLADEGADSQSIIRSLEQSAHRARERLHISKGPKKVSDFLDNLLGEIDEDHPVKNVMTRFSKLDGMMGGFKPGDLIVVAATTAVGKTSFAACIAKNCGVPALIVSLEMSSISVARRILYSQAQVNRLKLLTAGLETEELSRIGDAYGVLKDIPVWIDDSANSPSTVRLRAVRHKEKHGLGLLIVDYLQLLSPDGTHGTREREVASMSRAMKMLALELQIPVIILSQLSRAPDKRKDPRPILSDLRESGAIEQDADSVLFLYRDYARIDKRLTEVLVQKNRDGATGMVLLEFDAETTTYKDVPETTEETV